jgi:DNA-binding NtrC family response regulator
LKPVADQPVVLESFPPEIDSRPNSLANAKQVAEATRIALALARNNYNRLRTAAELGICRMTLYTKMHLYGLMEAS